MVVSALCVVEAGLLLVAEVLIFILNSMPVVELSWSVVVLTVSRTTAVLKLVCVVVLSFDSMPVLVLSWSVEVLTASRITDVLKLVCVVVLSFKSMLVVVWSWSVIVLTVFGNMVVLKLLVLVVFVVPSFKPMLVVALYLLVASRPVLVLPKFLVPVSTLFEVVDMGEEFIDVAELILVIVVAEQGFTVEDAFALDISARISDVLLVGIGMLAIAYHTILQYIAMLSLYLLQTPQIRGQRFLILAP